MCPPASPTAFSRSNPGPRCSTRSACRTSRRRLRACVGTTLMFAIEWPTAPAVISDRDAALPSLSDFHARR